MSESFVDIRERLAFLGVVPSKDRGQNFLVDLAALEAIILFGKPDANEAIIEIGGGLGALTAELASIAPLTIVEIEEAFCREIEQKYPQCKVVNADIRSFDFAEMGKDLVVFGNLPYSLSTDIIMYLVHYHKIIKRAVVMLQKEFSERLFAVPGTKKYGALSVQVQLFAKVYPGPIISGDCFYPKASVESQVVEMHFLQEPVIPITDKFLFNRLVAAAFFRRRKKVLNSVLLSRSLRADLVKQAFTITKISPELRAEDLNVEDYVNLANTLSELEGNE